MSAGQNMDTKWQAQATLMGHNATIYPQTKLDTLAGLADVDVLIVASHDIVLTPARRNVVAGFVASKRGAYVQGEYIATFEGNIVFEQVLDGLGAEFSWGEAFQNQLVTVPAGCYATTPAAAPNGAQGLGVTGSAVGPGLQPLETIEGTQTPISFTYCRAGGGMIAVRTDKDDIRQGGAAQLMQNLIYKLGAAASCTQ